MEWDSCSSPSATLDSSEHKRGTSVGPNKFPHLCHKHKCRHSSIGGNCDSPEYYCFVSRVVELEARAPRGDKEAVGSRNVWKRVCTIAYFCCVGLVDTIKLDLFGYMSVKSSDAALWIANYFNQKQLHMANHQRSRFSIRYVPILRRFSHTKLVAV